MAAAAACMVAAPVQAKPKVQTFSDQAQILKRFPEDTGLVRHGAKVRLKTGGWLDITDNAFGPSAPTLCWYAPALHVAGICQRGSNVMVTTLIELNTGHRVSAPGLARLMPEPGLIALGPDKAHGVEADSVTLVQVKDRDLVDEGGAVFDDDYGPGAWVDGSCYRLTPKGDKGPAWLEKGHSGWSQVSAAQSKVCQKRHGR
jgi:hypothetical protein